MLSILQYSPHFTFIKFSSLLENLSGLYFFLDNRDNRNNVLLINGDIGYTSALIVINHDNAKPYYVGILCGGNNRGNSWGFKLLDLSYDKNGTVVISGGKYNIPFKIKLNHHNNTAVGVSIIPMANCDLNKLNFKLEREEYNV